MITSKRSTRGVTPTKKRKINENNTLCISPRIGILIGVQRESEKAFDFARCWTKQWELIKKNVVKNGNDLKPEAFYVKSLNLSCRAKEHLFIYFKMMQKKKKRAEKGVTCKGFENYRFFLQVALQSEWNRELSNYREMGKKRNTEFAVVLTFVANVVVPGRSFLYILTWPDLLLPMNSLILICYIILKIKR